jgi:hypothetical protein
MNNKNKQLEADQPWMPHFWVVDGKAVPVTAFEDDSRRKYATVKVYAAIMKACRNDNDI